ncbi:hypothetical protein HQ496_05845 [bacterium]|nr:hypothetical protein [bacterium]
MKTNININMNRIGQRFFALLLAPLLLSSLFLAACDSTSGLSGDDEATTSLAQSVSFIASDLGLTSSESATLSASMARHAGDGSAVSQEAGYLWRVAAELQATLSDEQKAALFERIELAGQRDRQAGMQQGPGNGMKGPGGAQRMQQGQGQGGALSQLGLTEDQLAQIEAIREAYKPEIEAILAQRETLSREEIKAAVDAIREAVRAEVEAVLTDDQKQQLADFQAEAEARRAEHQAAQEANREASKLVMIEVLGLTPDQVAALEGLRVTGEEDRLAIEALVESGADRETVMAAASELRAAHQEAVAAILDQTQLEITLIHNALASRMGQGHGGQGGQGGPGMRGPGGQGGQGMNGGQGGPGMNGGPGMRPGQGFGGQPGSN